MKTKVTIIGGSNSTHTLIPLLTKNENSINLLTRNPNKWKHKITMEYTQSDGKIKDILEGEIDRISNQPDEVIPGADIIILSLPVSQYRNLLNQIAPYIDSNKKVYIGTIYGQGGFNWMIKEIKLKYNLDNLIYFASGLIPWITRTKSYGEVGINYGCKKINVVTVEPHSSFGELKDLLLDDLCYTYFKKGEYVQADNFISLTLSVDNQIIHQTRLYAMYLKTCGEWDSYDKVPYFYRDYDDISAEILGKLDGEYEKIRQAIKAKFPKNNFKYMLDYLTLERLSYGSSNEDIKESFRQSETLGQIPTPVIESEGKWVFDKNHRFFYDDIYYGITIAKWMAEKMNIETPMIDDILNWAQKILGVEIIKEKQLVNQLTNDTRFIFGTPDVYGYRSIEDIMG